jgi:hypothetical protein
VTLDLHQKLTNQDAFDIAVLHLLNQGHRSVSASGKSRYRCSRGKSAVGALIPEHLYAISMEGKTVHQLLAASGADYETLREHLGAVTASLLGELQDLHDRMGECLPSMFRHLVIAGCTRIARMFSLNMRLVQLCMAYQRIPGPQFIRAAAGPLARDAMNSPEALSSSIEDLKRVA